MRHAKKVVISEYHAEKFRDDPELSNRFRRAYDLIKLPILIYGAYTAITWTDPGTTWGILIGVWLMGIFNWVSDKVMLMSWSYQWCIAGDVPFNKDGRIQVE